MYQEEYYQDKIDYQQDNASISDSNSSLDSNDRKYLKEEHALKMKDLGYYSYKKKIGYETIKVECFATQVYKTIRNACTGVYTKHRVGSKEQDLYFTVTDLSGRGRKLNIPKHLYYDSPEEYERHQCTQVSQETKEKWYVKNLRARKNLIK